MGVFPMFNGIYNGGKWSSLKGHDFKRATVFFRVQQRTGTGLFFFFLRLSPFAGRIVEPIQSTRI